MNPAAMRQEISGEDLPAENLLAEDLPVEYLPAEKLQLDYTGERLMPGSTPESTFREHQMRYLFAGQFVPGKIVLDIASGSGIGTHYLRQTGAKICFGLDLELAALRFAKSRYPLTHLAACDAAHICLAAHSVEVIVSFETIEHLADPQTFLEECHRVLRPGGLLICSTPNRKITKWDRQNPFHVAEMSVPDFCRQVHQVFADCRFYAQAPVFYPVFVAKKMLIAGLSQLRLKEWVKSCLRIPVEAVCADIEFSAGQGDPRYAVSESLPRWPLQPGYAIVVARKSSSSA